MIKYTTIYLAIISLLGLELIIVFIWNIVWAVFIRRFVYFFKYSVKVHKLIFVSKRGKVYTTTNYFSIVLLTYCTIEVQIRDTGKMFTYLQLDCS